MVIEYYASPQEEAAAVRRSAARVGCEILSLDVRRIGNGPVRLVGSIGCKDGWTAAALLLALSEEDAKTAGARSLARALRAGATDDAMFARAVHAFVRKRVRFAREEGEIFQSGAFTLQEGFGDCDDHFRAVYSLARAGGLEAKLGILHHGDDAPWNMLGPAHATAVLCPRGACQWAETTVDAHFGENPNDAARRLGLTDERSDIAKEVVIMSAGNLPPLPNGFRDRNPVEQVRLDVEALQRLGYLSGDYATDDAGDAVLRSAVLAFQIARGITPHDGELGPTTRTGIAHALTDAGVEGFDYPGIGAIGLAATPVVLTKHLSDEFFRGVRAMAAGFRAGGATTTAEDLLLVWLSESGIRNIPNGQGYPYGGLNQMGAQERKAAGFVGTLSDWIAMPASQQLPFIDRFYRSATGGKLSLMRDASSLYLINFTPAFVSHAADPGFVLFRRNTAGPLPTDGEDKWKPWRDAHPSDAYAANRGFDRRKDGTIQVGDLGVALQAAAARSGAYWKEVQARLASTPDGSGIIAGVVVLLGAAGAIGGALYASGAFT